MMTPEQQQFLQMILSNVGGGAVGAYSDLLKPFSEQDFQTSIVAPTEKAYKEQALPAIQQRFVDANAGSSSALNQALAQSAGDMSNLLAQQRIAYQQGIAQRQAAGIGGLSQLLGMRSFDPIVQGPQGGLLRDLLQGGMGIAGGYFLSSREVKESIRDYNKGLDVVRKFDVKQYNYKPEVTVEVHNDRVGLIAEDLPDELVGEVAGAKAVDLYGLVAVLVNAVKELDARIAKMEGK